MKLDLKAYCSYFWCVLKIGLSGPNFWVILVNIQVFDYLVKKFPPDSK